MTGPVLKLSGDKHPHIGPALLAVATDLESARAALTAGADIVDLDGAQASDIAAFNAWYPGVAFCAADDRAALTREPALARTGGGLLICDDVAAAVHSGLAADRLVVQTTPAGIPAVAHAGYAALVDAELSGQGAGVAAAALSCWLGAALVRTRHPRAVRRALDMTASILGIRPPARTVRGLA